MRDQLYLEELYRMPLILEQLSTMREESGEGLLAELDELHNDKLEETRKEKPRSTAKALEDAVPSSPKGSMQSTHYVQPTFNVMPYFHVALAASFFLMALFPDFRAWAINRFIDEFSIDVVPPLLLLGALSIFHSLAA